MAADNQQAGFEEGQEVRWNAETEVLTDEHGNRIGAIYPTEMGVINEVAPDGKLWIEFSWFRDLVLVEPHEIVVIQRVDGAA